MPEDVRGVEERIERREPNRLDPSTRFIISVPVVAPQLYDVILRNTGSQPLDALYVTFMAQEI